MTELSQVFGIIKKETVSRRTYRVSVTCDQFKTGLQITVESNVTVPVSDLKEKLREAFETIVDRIYIGGEK